MSTETIREKLHNFIDTADDKKVEAIYTLVEDDIEEVYDHWEDEAFVSEMDQRIKDFESGKVKGIPWEEVKLKAEHRLKTKH
jgi:hypothetical protein